MPVESVAMLVTPPRPTPLLKVTEIGIPESETFVPSELRSCTTTFASGAPTVALAGCVVKTRLVVVTAAAVFDSSKRQNNFNIFAGDHPASGFLICIKK